MFERLHVLSTFSEFGLASNDFCQIATNLLLMLIFRLVQAYHLFLALLKCTYRQLQLVVNRLLFLL